MESASNAKLPIPWVVFRSKFKPDYTEGYLFRICGDDKEYVCDTLERGWKEKQEVGKTAIPFGIFGMRKGVSGTGAYKGRTMVYIDNVPGRSGIMFHDGMYPTNSHGCVLIGPKRTKTTPAGQLPYEAVKTTRDSVMKRMFDDMKSGAKVTVRVTAMSSDGTYL